MKKQIGVILSGCGVYDGSEIHEATLSLYFLDKLGINVKCFSINEIQRDVINHLAQSQESVKRNILEESARISRGEIQNISEANANNLDALILPGGFGAAKNLSDFAINGSNITINESLKQLIQNMHQQQKPLGFICISPVIAAAIIPNVTLTIGEDPGTANAIETMGAIHQNCSVNDIVIDNTNNVVTTPAYMFGNASISMIAKGIEKLATEVVNRTKVPIAT